MALAVAQNDLGNILENVHLIINTFNKNKSGLPGSLPEGLIYF
jgi:hypothetical protein